MLENKKRRLVRRFFWTSFFFFSNLISLWQWVFEPTVESLFCLQQQKTNESVVPLHPCNHDTCTQRA